MAILSTVESFYDVILVDMSPSCGALNRVMAMSCDLILIPTFASVYSAVAIYNMFRTVLPEWYAWRSNLIRMQSDPVWGADNENDIRFQFKSDPPRILPVVMTNYEIMETSNTPGQAVRYALDDGSSDFVTTFISHIHRKSQLRQLHCHFESTKAPRPEPYWEEACHLSHFTPA